MEKEMISEPMYLQIVANQTSILEELEKTNLMLSNVNDLSNRFVRDAFSHFRQGTEAIARIRSNLDEIHKSLNTVKKSKAALEPS